MKTALSDFIKFVESELCLPFTSEQRKIFNEQKEASLKVEKAQITEAHIQGFLSTEDSELYYEKNFKTN